MSEKAAQKDLSDLINQYSPDDEQNFIFRNIFIFL